MNISNERVRLNLLIEILFSAPLTFEALKAKNSSVQPYDIDPKLLGHGEEAVKIIQNAPEELLGKMIESFLADRGLVKGVIVNGFTVTMTKGVFAVEGPYNEQVIAAAKGAGGKWDGQKWTLPKHNLRMVKALLETAAPDGNKREAYTILVCRDRLLQLACAATAHANK